jgi:hypothetical protein
MPMPMRSQDGERNGVTTADGAHAARRGGKVDSGKLGSGVPGVAIGTK